MTDQQRKIAIRKLRTENEYLRAENLRLKQKLATIQQQSTDTTYEEEKVILR